MSLQAINPTGFGKYFIHCATASPSFIPSRSKSVVGIFEIFVIDDEARKLIYEKVSSSVLRARAREMGMRTLREDGIRKVLAGMTTPEEVIRATVGDDA